MTDRGVIFSGPMVRALIDGRKRQTRRLATSPLRRCVPGDRLWVRESFFAEELSRPPKRFALCARDRRLSGRTHADIPDDLDGADGLSFLADDAWERIENTPEAADRWMKAFQYGLAEGEDVKGRRGKTVPAIHMPRWASRLTLVVRNVWTGPLCLISPEDCVAEGHERAPHQLPEEVHLDAARDWYIDLWDSLHSKEGERWRDNPPVVAVEFEVVASNIDRL